MKIHLFVKKCKLKFTSYNSVNIIVLRKRKFLSKNISQKKGNFFYSDVFIYVRCKGINMKPQDKWVNMKPLDKEQKNSSTRNKQVE